MKVRAKTKEGTEVVGWYGEAEDCWEKKRYFIVPQNGFWVTPNNVRNAVEIDPSTVAVATGKQDKNGVEIFGNKGKESNGSDRLRAEYRCDAVHDNEPHILEGWVEFDEGQGMWMFDYGHTAMPLCYLDSECIEIIKDKDARG